MIPKEKAFSNIESIHSRVLTTSSQFFNDTLCELYKEIQEQGLEETLDAHASADKDRDTAPLKQFEVKLIEELRSANHYIEEYYQQNNLSLPQGFMCPPGISEFRAYDEGILISRAPAENDTISLEDTRINALIWAVSTSLSLLMYDQVPEENIWALIIRLAIVNVETETDKRVIKLRDSSSQGLQHAYAEISKFITTNQIINVNLRGALEQFCEYQSCEYRSEEKVYKEPSMHVALIRALQILLIDEIYSAHHINFVKNFAYLDENGRILVLKIAPTINTWEAEKSDLERRKKATFWYAWEQFKQFYIHYKHHSRHKTAARNNRNYLLEQDLHAESVILDQPDVLRRYEEFIFFNLKKILLTETNAQNVSTQHALSDVVVNMSPLAFDSVTGILTIEGHKIIFPKEKAANGIVRPILSVITQIMPSLNRQCSWDEIGEKIDGEIPKNPIQRKKYKRKLWDAYKYINKEVLKQSNHILKPLLIFNMNNCYIAPVYH